LAKSVGAEVKSPEAFTRADAVAGLGSATMLLPAFQKNAGELAGPFAFGTDFCILKVTEKIPADLTQLAAQRSEMQQGLKRERAMERATLFKEGIMQTLIKSKKLKIYEKNIKLLQGSYLH
jgi:hypothetical protein